MNTASTHMAIVIKKHNRKKLGILTGMTPSKKSIGDIFVFPYDYDETADILTIANFLANFTIPTTLTDSYFSDVVRI